MRKFDFSSVFLVLVSVFGLVSCAADKGKDTSATQDTFRVAQPIIMSDRGSVAVTDPAAVSTEFSTESILSFPSLKQMDFVTDPVMIEVRSDCKGRVQASASDMQYANTAEIPLRDLLPAEVLFQPGATAQPVHCLLHFKVTNRHGSVHSFKSANLTLVPPKSSLGIELRSIEPNVSEAASQIAQDTLSALRLERPTVKDFKETVHLLCEGFRTKLSAARFETEGVASLARLAPAAYENRAIVDSAADPVQECRIVSESNDGIRKIRASRQFQIAFSPPKLKVTSRIEFDGYTSSLRIPVFTATIHNPYSVEIPAAIARGRETSLVLQGVVENLDLSGTIGPALARPIELTLEGTTALADTNYLKFVVPPGQSVIVRGFVSFTYYCQTAGRPGISIEFGSGFLGYYFHIDRNEFALLQTADNRLEADSSFVVGSREPFLDFQPSPLPSRPLPYWMPWTRAEITGSLRTQKAREPVHLQPAATSSSSPGKFICIARA